MNTVCIYIDENLDHATRSSVRNELLNVPHVVHVEMKDDTPHDVAVEFEPHHNIPMTLLTKLENKGLHPDIFSC